MAVRYFAPAGLGTSGSGLSRSNPIYGLSDMSMVQAGDEIVLLPGTYQEALIIPQNNLKIISENAIFDGSISINGTNTLNNSFVEVSGSNWQLVDSGLNLWKKGHRGTWNVYLNGEWIEPMPSSNNTNSESAIIAAIGINEWTISTAVNTDSMGATLYLRLPNGISPNSVDLRCSHTRRYNPTGSTSIMAGAIEAVAKENIKFIGDFTVRRVNNSAGARVPGVYLERCIGLDNAEGQFNIKNCFLPMRIAGGDNVRIKFKADYCNNSIAVQNSNEASGTIFSKAGTIEIFDWEANYCGWMPRYDGTIVNANNDQDGGVGIGYVGGDIARVIVRNGVCRNGGPSVPVLKAGWSGTVAKGSGIICSTVNMVIDSLEILNNRIENTNRSGISITSSSSTFDVKSRKIIGNVIINNKGVPIATNLQASILNSSEPTGQATACEHIICNNTIIGGTYTSAAIVNNRTNVNSTVTISNNIVKNCTIETGYAGNYGAMQLVQNTNLNVNFNLFDTVGNGVIGRVVNTNYSTIGTFNTAVSSTTNIEQAVTFNNDYSITPRVEGTKYWSTNPRPTSLNNEPLPDTSIDIGAYQSTTSPFHPANL